MCVLVLLLLQIQLTIYTRIHSYMKHACIKTLKVKEQRGTEKNNAKNGKTLNFKSKENRKLSRITLTNICNEISNCYAADKFYSYTQRRLRIEQVFVTFFFAFFFFFSFYALCSYSMAFTYSSHIMITKISEVFRFFSFYFYLCSATTLYLRPFEAI